MAIKSKREAKAPKRPKVSGPTRFRLPANSELASVREAAKGLKKNGKRRRNPLDASLAATAAFHGKPADEMVEVESEHHYHKYVWQLGELLQLDVIAADDSGVVELAGFEGARLCANEPTSADNLGNQLFIVGGDQYVDIEEFGLDEIELHEAEVLGQIEVIWYYTIKEHLGDDGGEADYHHSFGEEDSKRRKRAWRPVRKPTLVYNYRDASLSIVGGGYRITALGIEN